MNTEQWALGLNRNYSLIIPVVPVLAECVLYAAYESLQSIDKYIPYLEDGYAP
jgi:hypothetical protein